jgi:hypothetical protein
MLAEEAAKSKGKRQRLLAESAMRPQTLRDWLPGEVASARRVRRRSGGK